MKKPSYFLSIPEPCSQQWSDMEPSAKGRSCKHCNKEVIDFTTFSELQLLNYMKAAPGEVCGHISTKMLNRSYTSTTTHISGLSLPALVLLAATLSVNAAFGQTEPVKTEFIPAPLPVPVAADPTTPTGAVSIISGKVTELTGEGIQFARIRYRANGEGKNLITDENGAFSITNSSGTILFLNVYADNRVSQTIILPEGNRENLVVAMEWEDVIVEGAMYFRREDEPLEAIPVKSAEKRKR